MNVHMTGDDADLGQEKNLDKASGQAGALLLREMILYDVMMIMMMIMTIMMILRREERRVK